MVDMWIPGANFDNLVRNQMEIERELTRQREQVAKYKKAYTPYRVVFCYPGDIQIYYYYPTKRIAKGSDTFYIAVRSMFGENHLIASTSKHIQVKGPRGRWERIPK